MNASSQPNASGHHVAPRQQAVVRAVVGSIMLCAALGATTSAQTPASSQELSQQSATHEQLRLARLQRLSDLLAEVRQRSDSIDFDAGKTFSITVNAEAIGNEDDPLHSFKVECGADTDKILCGAAEEMLVFLRGSMFRQLLTEAHRVGLTLRLGSDDAVASLLVDFGSAGDARRAGEVHRKEILRALQDYSEPDLHLVLNNMKMSANGKQMSLKLEMSREQAGNLLRKHLSLP